MFEDPEKLEKSFAYIRVSTDIQEEKKTQENQEKAIKDYVKKYNIEVIEWFYDLALSGVDLNRPKLNEMLSRLSEVQSIIIYDTSRLSRNFEYSIGLIFQFKNLGKRIHVVSEGAILDYQNDMNQLIEIIKSWYNAYERKKILARQKLGIERYKEKNGRWGRKTKKLDVKKYNFLRKSGVSKSAIARILKISRTTLWERLKELKIDY